MQKSATQPATRTRPAKNLPAAASRPTRKSSQSLREWWDDVGTANVQLVAAELEITMNYMHRLRCRARRPSPDLAMRIIDAATRITPGFAPSVTRMLEALPPPGAPGVGNVIPPSATFTRSQARRRRA